MFSCRSHGYHFCLIFFKDSFRLLFLGHSLSLILCHSCFGLLLFSQRVGLEKLLTDVLQSEWSW